MKPGDRLRAPGSRAGSDSPAPGAGAPRCTSGSTHSARAGRLEADEAVLPDAFLLQAAEEALDDPVLLGRVRRDELLHEPVVSTRRPKVSTLIDQTVVGADDGGSSAGAQGAEPFQTGLLERPLGLLGPPAQGELVADELPVVAINHPGEMGPAVAATVHMN